METPVPVREMVWGLPLALSVMDTDAEREPEAVGVKERVNVQEALTARDAGQLSLSVKSPGFVPPRAILIMVRDAVPVLVRVSVWLGEVVPTA